MNAPRALPLIAALLVACGGTQTPPPEEPEAPVPEPAPDDPDDGMQLEGQTGTISRMAVEAALGGQLERLGGCYRDALGAQPWLLGDVVLSFRIARDGSVRWVIPVSSTIGDQATQACLLERARGIRFSRPVGGEAEASYPLAFNPGSGRPPDVWIAADGLDAISEHRPEIEACGVSGEGYSLTVYVDRGGVVPAAGVSYPNPEAATVADCVARAAKTWTLPDPGSWIAKFTVDL
jgi:hypothetical protein